MALQTRISIVSAKAALDAFTPLLDAGTGANPLLRIYSGTQPASPDAAVGTQTKLAEIDLGTAAPFFPAAGTSGNSATSTASAKLPKTDTAATATGTASWFRAVDQSGTGLIDGSVGTTGTDMILDNTSIVIGQEIRLNTWKVKLSKV